MVAFITALLLNQYHVRRHVQSVRLMNQRLESSNNQLGIANTALQQFAGMVSHDLSTPLRHIGFYSDLVEENCAEPATVREHVSVIKNAVLRMDTLISSLLDFTRTGFVKPTLVPVDVSALINGVVQELRSTIESRGATVNLQLSGCVLADPELLRRILYNLIDNSLKYVPTDRPPRINVEAIAEAGGITFSVSDNGIGIEAKFAERIFEPGQRLHDTQSQFTGSGIGLSLVKAVIDAHAGSIHLDTQYSAGARFVFHLDAAESPLWRRPHDKPNTQSNTIS